MPVQAVTITPMGPFALPARSLLPCAAVTLALSVTVMAFIIATAFIVTPSALHPSDTVLLSAAGAGDALRIWTHNLLVLALYLLVCHMRLVTLRSRSPLAAAGLMYVTVVAAAAAVSQVVIVGADLAALAQLVGRSPLSVGVALTPHALPELAALLLPVALLARPSLRNDAARLQGALIRTVPAAAVVLLAAALIEVTFTSTLLTR